MTRKQAYEILEFPQDHSEEEVANAEAFFREWEANHTQGGLEY